MKILTIFADKEILNNESDVHKRHADYSKLVDEFHIQYFDDEINTSQKDSLFFYSLDSKNLFSLVKNLRNYIKKNNIDLLICPRPFYPGIIAVLLKIVTGKKLLMSIYGSNIYEKKWFLDSIKNLIFRVFFGPIIIYFSDYVQTDSRRDQVFFEKNFKKKKIFWKPMIPANISDFNFDRIINLDKKFNIIFIGRLVKQKNIRLLSQIIEKLFKINPNVCFTVIGDGKFSNLIKKLKDENPDKLFWYKNSNRSEIVDLYKNSDLLLLCSNYEGFPRVFMEAAVSAIPIVTSNVSGIENVVINDKTGFVLQDNSPDNFVQVLNFLEKHREMSYNLGIESRKKFMKTFDYNTTLIAQQEVFEYITNNISKK